MTENPNIFLLTIDALRADHLGYHGYDRDTSPFLDSLADQTACFRTAISASSHTREAIPALLTGRHPDLFAANGYRCVTDTVADQLQTAGYATAGFHSNPYVSRAYGFDSGFNTFDDDLRMGQHRVVALIQRALDKFLLNKGEYHARAEIINQRSLDWLDKVDDGPVLLWNHYMDPHGPYNPPNGYSYVDEAISNGEAHDLYQTVINHPEGVSDNQKQLLLDCYDGEIRYLDDQLRKFFDELEERGLLRDSLVIIIADHGEAFGEHGFFTHPRRLYEYLIHVPLLISSPAGEEMSDQDGPVSSLDLVPSILDSADLATTGLPGKSLLCSSDRSEGSEENIVFASATGENQHEGTRRFAARGREVKVQVERNIESGEILDETAYEIELDPDERNPQDPTAIGAADIAEKLRGFSESRLRSEGRGATEYVTIANSDEIDERLEALGYK
jgi:arylsulfatase